MSGHSQTDLSVQEIASALGTLWHLQEKIEGVWQDFFAEVPGLLSREVTDVHLQRVTEALAQQIEKSLSLAFGDDSRPLHQFRSVGLLPTSPRSLMDVQLFLDSQISTLQHKRVELLRFQHQSLTTSTDTESFPMSSRPEKLSGLKRL
jgi:hypothetical protein